MRRRRTPLWLVAIATFLISQIAGAPAVNATAPERPPFDTSEWRTDFGKHSVPYSEIMSGGPQKDGIRAIDKPEFVAVGAADRTARISARNEIGDIFGIGDRVESPDIPGALDRIRTGNPLITSSPRGWLPSWGGGG